jgi:DNA-binding Xre family transcriptional regulator
MKQRSAPSRSRRTRRERVGRGHHLRIPFAELLARKMVQEQRIISEREVRDVTGLSYHRIKALLQGESAGANLRTLEILLTFFDCTLEDLVQDAPRELAQDDPLHKS